MGAGANGGGGGGRAARALRLLLLLVLALAAVEYLFGSILEASPLRTYIYTPLYNSTQSTLRNSERLSSYWPKRLPISYSQTPEAESRNTTVNHNVTFALQPLNSTVNFTKSTQNVTMSTSTQKSVIKSTQNVTKLQNMTAGDAVTPQVVSKMMDSITKKSTEGELPLCDNLPADLGPITANKTDLELEEVDVKFPAVHWGGRHAPRNCTARHRVAIIVPYRDREQHLAVFLNHMHPFLMKQQLDYGIFIVEQEGTHDFNRAKLMNVGFAEAQRLRAGGWQCFIFHDIDLLPLDGRNMYSCPRQPRHMSASIDKLQFKLPYEDIFGGVSALTREQFTKVNGFSNKYWGWGGEDDDMSYRLRKMNYHVARYKMSIARYAMLNHKKSSPNPKRYQLLSQTSKTFQKDGLSTLQYELIEVTQHHLYTHVLANIDERS